MQLYTFHLLDFFFLEILRTNTCINSTDIQSDNALCTVMILNVRVYLNYHIDYAPKFLET